MMLLVDIGNTRVKWVQTDGSTWSVQYFVLEPQDFEGQLQDAWSGLPAPDKICVACVAAHEIRDKLTGWCQRHWGMQPVFAETQAEQLGVINDYEDPAALGTDRWLNLLAARHLLAGKVCVIDCGSAVTIDALSDDGHFIGGVIIPGLSMMRKSLARETAAIRPVHGRISVFPAQNTEDGVYTGTLAAMYGAIRHIVKQFREHMGDDMTILLTGGDAQQLVEGLGEEVEVEPDLVLRGLALIVDKI